MINDNIIIAFAIIMKQIISRVCVVRTKKVGLHKLVILVFVMASINVISYQMLLTNCILNRTHNDVSDKQARSDSLPNQVHAVPIISTSPNTVYYIWCGRRLFEFQHYLSVLSVIHFIQPDGIVFLFDVAPALDKHSYITWFEEITTKHAFFRSQQLNKTDFGCAGTSTPNMTFVLNFLNRSGGVYVSETAVLTDPTFQYRLYKKIVPSVEQFGNLLITTRGRRRKTIDRMSFIEGAERDKTLFCDNVVQFNSTDLMPRCVHLTSALYPKDIWEADTSFARLARTLFYGSPDVQRPVPTYEELVPNIGHLVWIGGGRMSFLFYLCVLSLIHIVEVDMVYIHGDSPPIGRYWKLLKNNSKVQCVYRDPPVLVYGNNVQVRSHVSDAWRVDLMIKYGGIYIDTDAVFVKPLDRKIRGYDAVGTYDWPLLHHPFPDIINLGITIGKRGAPYWHRILDSMRDFRDNDWTWNGLRQPYKIRERYPKLVHIDPHLAVICFQSLCHPTWWPDYHNVKIHHINAPPGMSLDWRKDVYAFHWTSPTPPELQSHTLLLRTNSTFADIGKYILEKAGMMEYFQRIL